MSDLTDPQKYLESFFGKITSFHISNTLSNPTQVQLTLETGIIILITGDQESKEYLNIPSKFKIVGHDKSYNLRQMQEIVVTMEKNLSNSYDFIKEDEVYPSYKIPWWCKALVFCLRPVEWLVIIKEKLERRRKK